MKLLRFTLLLGILVCTFSMVSAQNLGTKNVTVSYVQKPLNPLPADIQTYSTMIRSGYALFDNKEEFERNFLRQLTGYQHVQDGGDLLIIATFRGLDIVNYEEKHDSKEEEETTTSGSPNFNYRYNVTYTFPMKYEIINQKTGETIYEEEMSDMFTEHKANFGKNNEFATLAELEKAFKERKGEFFVNLENRKAREFLVSVKDTIQSQYAHPRKNYIMRVGFGKGRKQDYSDLEKARDLAVRGYQLIGKDMDAINEFREAIEIWETALQEANLQDKKARINQKIARWLHYNLAMAYAWLDDYEMAEKHVLETELVSHQGVLAASFESKDLKAFVQNRKERYEANL